MTRGLITFILLAFVVPGAAALPSGFVFLRDVAPGIEQDMRYATANNFTGKPVPGYIGAECILAAPVAESLARIQMELEKSGLTLIVYDCYRPVSAVKRFVRWTNEPGPLTDHRYYPRVPKNQLQRRGYIASRSGHSTGKSVDLTIGRKRNTASAEPVDMGSSFDLFDPLSHSGAKGVSTIARLNRDRLATIMRKYGFIGYHREWWHFHHQSANRNDPAMDFDIPPRP